MKGNGNNLSTYIEKIHFFLIPSSGKRSQYIEKHKDRFHHVGKDIFWQPRKFPTDPELISLGDNVRIASDVTFITHDIANSMLNRMREESKDFNIPDTYLGGVCVGDNVMIGAGTIILPDVSIGSNCIIGAGSVVTKDIPSNSVAAGVPCRVVGNFNEFVEKRKRIKYRTVNEIWKKFDKEHLSY